MENGNKPAFAHACTTADGSTHSIEEGLSKREYFAGLAMQSICGFEMGQGYDIAREYAKRSVIMADALLAELEKPKT